jgi:hypothetical protein
MLAVANNGTTHRLGYSVREVVDRLRADDKLLRDVGRLTTPWMADARARAASSMLTEKLNTFMTPEKWDQPFSSLL